MTRMTDRIISFIQTVLDNMQQDRMGKKRRKIEIIDRPPFTGHSIYQILLTDCRECCPYLTWGQSESQSGGYHARGYTVVTPAWTHTPHYLPTSALSSEFSGTSDVTEPMTSRGEWKIREHLVQPRTIKHKTEVQRGVWPRPRRL